MGMSVNTNISALQAAATTKKTSGLMAKALNQMASGLRINKAADDAAGLAIAERFRTQVAQYNQEITGYQSGANAIQMAEGGLSTQQDAIARVRELAVQASNGTLSDSDRAAINTEAQQLMAQINETGNNTEFNGQQLLTGGVTNLQMGPEGGPTLTIGASNTTTLGLNGLDLSTAGGATSAIDALDTAAQRVSANRASLGAQQNRFASAIEQRSIAAQNSAESESLIRDADIARATTESTRNQLLLRSGLSALTQSNLIPQNMLNLLGG